MADDGLQSGIWFLRVTGTENVLLVCRRRGSHDLFSVKPRARVPRETPRVLKESTEPKKVPFLPFCPEWPRFVPFVPKMSFSSCVVAFLSLA